MKHLLCALQFCLVVLVVDIQSRIYPKYPREEKKDYDCSSQQEPASSECDSDNEVNTDSRQHYDDSKEHSDVESTKTATNPTAWEVVRYESNREASTQIVDTSTTATTTEEEEPVTYRIPRARTNVTCPNQANRSEEDNEDMESTLVDYPFSVSIQKKGAHYVSGALIDKRWILSVAGEFYNVRESLKLFRARLGSVDCKKGGSLVPIKRIEIHPYFVPGKPNFDIALLRMALPVDYSDVLRPIGVSNIRGKVLGAKFMTTYWPRIVVKGQALPETAKERIKYNSMRVSTQRLIPTETCTKVMLAMNEHLNESSLCLNPVLTHHSICMPDAGAPVVAEDGLWGITSGWIAPTCPTYAGPTIFTRLSSSSVRSWLDIHLLNV